MPRKFNSSKLRGDLRRVERKRRQAINKFNRVVDSHNREVRARNSRVRRNRQRLINELNRLGAKRTTVRYVRYQASAQTLRQSFFRVEAAADQGTWRASDDLFDLAEGEAANSVAVLNALLEESSTDVANDVQLRQTVITTELRNIDPDLDARWQGALYSLNPANPDAARHFCTSSREILTRIVDLKAPDAQILAAHPNVVLTQNGQVPRREKIRYSLSLRGEQDDDLVDFIENDIDNVMDLFADLNPATDRHLLATCPPNRGNSSRPGCSAVSTGRSSATASRPLACAARSSS